MELDGLVRRRVKSRPSTPVRDHEKFRSEIRALDLRLQQSKVDQQVLTQALEQAQADRSEAARLREELSQAYVDRSVLLTMQDELAKVSSALNALQSPAPCPALTSTVVPSAAGSKKRLNKCRRCSGRHYLSVACVV